MQDTAGDKELLYRRPQGFWAEFNTWWRAVFSSTGRRPDGAAIDQWWLENAERVWPDASCRPDMLDTRTHAKCMRTTETVREYFKKYRQMHRDKRPWQGRAVYTEKPPPKAPKARARSGSPKRAGARPKPGPASGSGSTSQDEAEAYPLPTGGEGSGLPSLPPVQPGGVECGANGQQEAATPMPQPAPALRFSFPPALDIGAITSQAPGLTLPSPQEINTPAQAAGPLAWHSNSLPVPAPAPATASLLSGMRSLPGGSWAPGSMGLNQLSPVSPHGAWSARRQVTVPPPAAPPPSPSGPLLGRNWWPVSNALHGAPSLGPLAATAVAALQAAAIAPVPPASHGNAEQLQALAAQEVELDRAITSELEASNALLLAAGRGASATIESLALSAAEHRTDMAFAALACAAEAAGLPWDNVDTSHPLWHVFEMRAVVFAAQHAVASGQPIQPSTLRVPTVHVMKAVVKAVDRLREFVTSRQPMPPASWPTPPTATVSAANNTQMLGTDAGLGARTPMANAASGESSSPILPGMPPSVSAQRMDPPSPKSHATQHSSPSDNSTTPMPALGVVPVTPALPAMLDLGSTGLLSPAPLHTAPTPSHGQITTTATAAGEHYGGRGVSPRRATPRASAPTTPNAARASPPPPALRKRHRASTGTYDSAEDGMRDHVDARPTKAASPRHPSADCLPRMPGPRSTPATPVAASLDLAPSPFALLSSGADDKQATMAVHSGQGLDAACMAGASGAWGAGTVDGQCARPAGTGGALQLPGGPAAVRATASGSSHEGATTPLGPAHAVTPVSAPLAPPACDASGNVGAGRSGLNSGAWLSTPPASLRPPTNGFRAGQFSRFRPPVPGSTTPELSIDELNLCTVFGNGPPPQHSGGMDSALDTLWSWENLAARRPSPAPGSMTLALRPSKNGPAPFAHLHAHAQLADDLAMDRATSLGGDLGGRISWLPRLPDADGEAGAAAGGVAGVSMSRQVSMNNLLIDGARISSDIDAFPLHVLLDQEAARNQQGLGLRLSWQQMSQAARACVQAAAGAGGGVMGAR